MNGSKSQATSRLCRNLGPGIVIVLGMTVSVVEYDFIDGVVTRHNSLIITVCR